MIDIWDYFDRFADAPNGIEKLRQLILDLAIRGKLVDFSSDNKTEQPIERLASQQQSIADKRLSKQIEKYKSVPADVVPVGDHNTCDYVYLGSVADMHNGRSFKSSEWSENGTPIIRIQNLNDHQKPFNRCDVEVAEKHHINSGDILISWSGTPGTSFGAFIWERGFAYLNQHINRVDLIGNVLHPEFFVLAVNAKLDELIQKAQGGVGLKHVTKATLNELVLPLPDIEIQQQVIGEYNRLMAICDELEEKQTRRQSLHVNLNDSALDKLVKSESPAEFADRWGFIADNFELLYRHPDNIPKLRQGILDLAVRGKLVEQDPEDEPAEELFNGEVMPTLNDVPFFAPRGWSWYKLQQVSEFLGGFAFKSTAYVMNSKNQIIRLGNVKNDALLLKQNPAFISSELARASGKYQIKCGDILITMTGTKKKRDYLFTTQVKASDLDEYELYLNQRVGRLRFPCEHLARTANHFLKTDVLLDPLFFAATGTANQGNVGAKAIRSGLIPVPPLEEQKRIVARVDELMAILDELEAKLQTSQENAAEFAESMAGTLV